MKWLCLSMKSCPDMWLVTLMKITKVSVLSGYEPCASRIRDRSVGTGSQYSTVPTLHCIGTGSQYSTVHTLYCTAPHCTRPSRVLLCTAHLYRSHSGRCSALCDRPTCLTAYCKLRVSVDTVFVKRRTARRPV